MEPLRKGGDHDGEEGGDGAAAGGDGVGGAEQRHRRCRAGHARRPAELGQHRGQVPPGKKPAADQRQQQAEGDGEPRQVLLDLAGDGRDGQAEESEDTGEAGGHGHGRGDGPGRGPRPGAGVVAEDEEREVSGQEREAVGVDGCEHARREGEGEGEVGHGGSAQPAKALVVPRRPATMVTLGGGGGAGM